MDISPEYVKMCGEAKEVQEAHTPARGDLWKCACRSCTERSHIWMIERSVIDHLEGKDLSDFIEYYQECVRWEEFGFPAFWRDKEAGDWNAYIWLPRQDQLQEMVFESGGSTPWLALFSDFVDFIFSKTNRGLFTGTPDQLWLAFVMHEKHNKIWDGKTWKQKS